MHESSPATSASPQPRILVSIVAEYETSPRPVVHLGLADNRLAADFAREYALGTCHSDGVQWNPLGPLNLQSVALERALLGVLSVLAMRQVREAQFQIGDPVLVLGSDPWSLLLLQWARLQGASPLVLVRRGGLVLGEQASFFGLDAELPDPTPSDLVRAVKLTHREAGFATAIDALGTEQSIALALPALRDGGRYVLAGLTPQPLVSLNAYPDLHRRDLELVSARHPANNAEMAALFRFSLTMAAGGRLKLESLLDPGSGWGIVTGNAEQSAS